MTESLSGMDTVQPLLQIRGLQVRYGAVEAVRGIDIDVPAKQIVALLGANGAGKSSTLNAAMGLAPIHAGSVKLRGQEIRAIGTGATVLRGMTLSPEGRLVFPDLTVTENLIMGAAGSRRLRARTAQNMEKNFDLFPKLRSRSQQMAGTLSGGEQQMVAIARALMSEPEILMLDEPSLGLAPNIVDQIFDLIMALNKAGTTILLVEQNAEHSLEIAHHAYVMQLGKVVASGTGQDLLSRGDLHAHYMGV